MNYLIIGGSAAGISAVEGIRSRDPSGKITLVSDETFPLYSRCLLSYYIAGSLPKEGLKIRDDAFFADNKVEAILGVRVEKVLPVLRKAVLSDGRELPYDRLLIASGAEAKLVTIPGIDKKGVFKLRSVSDADNIIACCAGAKSAVILGGGLVGLKNAYALRARGLEITVIVKSGSILSQVLDKPAADLVQEQLSSHGIHFRLGMDATEIAGDENASGVILENGERLDCRLVVVGKGVEPNISIVKDTGIKTGWGVRVNYGMQSNLPGIYAAGDAAEARDVATGEHAINALWPCAVEQGRIAGVNMAGGAVSYEGSLGMNSVDFYGMPIISAGITRPKGEGFEVFSSLDRGKKRYRKLVLRNNRLVGVVLLSAVENAGVYISLINKKADISSIRDTLDRDDFDFAKLIPLMKEQRYNFGEKEYSELLFK